MPRPKSTSWSPGMSADRGTIVSEVRAREGWTGSLWVEAPLWTGTPTAAYTSSFIRRFAHGREGSTTRPINHAILDA